MRMFEARYVFEHSLRDRRGPRLLRYLLEHGDDEFTNHPPSDAATT